MADWVTPAIFGIQFSTVLEQKKSAGSLGAEFVRTLQPPGTRPGIQQGIKGTQKAVEIMYPPFPKNQIQILTSSQTNERMDTSFPISHP